MRISIILLFIGLALLIVGVYLSSLLTKDWIIIGTLMAVLGGGLTGINTYFLASTKSNNT